MFANRTGVVLRRIFGKTCIKITIGFPEISFIPFSISNLTNITTRQLLNFGRTLHNGRLNKIFPSSAKIRKPNLHFRSNVFHYIGKTIPRHETFQGVDLLVRKLFIAADHKCAMEK